MTGIQQRFLWGGPSENIKIKWVAWNDVCKPKEDGGLGVKCLTKLNQSLLAKWRWWLLNDTSAMWYGLLYFRYDGENASRGDWKIPPYSSLWWRDIMQLDVELGWFDNHIRRKVGNGLTTLFCCDKWKGNMKMQHSYPLLFQVTDNKGVRVGEMIKKENEPWTWTWRWRRELFAWEEELILQMQETVDGTILLENQNDSWIWEGHGAPFFTVAGTYKTLLNLGNTIQYPSPEVFKNFWKCKYPSKVLHFLWQALLKKIPTRDALIRRGVSLTNVMCMLCNEDRESVNHLLITCRCAYKIWKEVYKWMGFEVVQHNDIQHHYTQHGTFARKKIQFFTVIFSQGAAMNYESVTELIKGLSWSWFRYLVPFATSVSFFN